MKEYKHAVVCSLIAAFATFSASLIHTQGSLRALETEFNLRFDSLQKENLYQIKKDSILKSLNTLDLFYSWQSYNATIPARRETTQTELTEMARECYNSLCVTCDNETLLNSFLDCIFGVSDNHAIPFELYNKFRNEARKELGLSPLNLPGDRIFLSVISTQELSEKAQDSSRPSQTHIPPL